MKNYKVTIEDHNENEVQVFEADRLALIGIDDTAAEDGKQVAVHMMGHYNGSMLVSAMTGLFVAIQDSTGINVKQLHHMINSAEKNAILNMDLDLSLPDDAPEELKQVAGKLNEIVAIMKNSVK